MTDNHTEPTPEDDPAAFVENEREKMLAFLRSIGVEPAPTFKGQLKQLWAARDFIESGWTPTDDPEGNDHD